MFFFFSDSLSRVQVSHKLFFEMIWWMLDTPDSIKDSLFTCLIFYLIRSLLQAALTIFNYGELDIKIVRYFYSWKELVKVSFIPTLDMIFNSHSEIVIALTTIFLVFQQY